MLADIPLAALRAVAWDIKLPNMLDSYWECTQKENVDLFYSEYLTTKVHEIQQNMIRIIRCINPLTSKNFKHSNFKILMTAFI